MKSYILTLSILFTAFLGMSASGEPTGNAGDNLDLNAVMELFKESMSSHRSLGKYFIILT